MRSKYLQTTSLLLLLIASPGCVKEVEQESQESLHEVVFHAGWDAETKTVLQEDGQVFWSPGDEISLFANSSGLPDGGYKLTSTNTEPSSHADFVGQVGEKPEGGYYVAVYPYDERNKFVYEENRWDVYIPSEQIAQEGTFDSNIFVNIAVSEDENLYFKNICSGIKFSVSTSGIKKVVIATSDGTYSSGMVHCWDIREETPRFSAGSSSSVVVNAPTEAGFEPGKYYYAILLAREYNGINVSYYTDNKVATYYYPETIDFKRGVFKRLYNKDAELDFEYTRKACLTLLLPNGEDQSTITEANFYVESEIETETVVGFQWDGYEPIYFERVGNVVNYYTRGSYFEISGMAPRFTHWKSLRALDLSSFDTKNTSSVSWMFVGCESLETVNLSSFDTSNVGDFSLMFSGCSSLKELDLSNFNTEKAVDMNHMFDGCENLRNLNISSFETANVKDFSYMFGDCKSLEHIDVSSFDMRSAVDLSQMFYNCHSLLELDASNWVAPNLERMTSMFLGCRKLESLNISGLVTSRVASMDSLFSGCHSLRSIDLTKFNTESLTSASFMFYECRNLENIDLSSFKTSRLRNMQSMFWGCSRLRTVDMSKWERTHPNDIRNMFYGCSLLANVDLSSLDTSDVTSLYYMFCDCSSLREVDLSSFNTSNVINMYGTFTGCESLKHVDLSSFDTNKLQDMSYMFYCCRNLISASLGSFNSTSLQNASALFMGCKNIQSLDLGEIDLTNVDISGIGIDLSNKVSSVSVKCVESTKNKLSSVLEEDVLNKITWYTSSDVLPDPEKEIDPSLYYSTDYSKDKTVRVLQTHSRGNGVDIVLMGDGYTDRLIADGTYDADVEKTANAIFANEPFKSYKDLFDIYVVYAVSENEVIGKSTAFGTTDTRGGWSESIGSEAPSVVYAYSRIGSKKSDQREIATVVVINSNAFPDGVVVTEVDWADDYQSHWLWDDYHGGESLCYVSGPRQSGFEEVVAHEFGHSFGKLADEYAYAGYGMIDSGTRQLYMNLKNYGLYKNVDFISSSENVSWAHLLKDSRYRDSGLGIFEGAARYENGIWRPTENSIMRDHLMIGVQFNAPSREAIYYRLHKLAYGKDWQYDYETFVQQDLKNIPSATSTASVKSVPYPARVNRKPLLKMKESTSPDGKKMVTVIMN